MEAADVRTPVNVILIGDHPVTLAGLEVTCAAAGDIRVLARADCEGALEALREGQPDVVIIDAYLPAFCGDEITSEIKQGEPGAAVLVLAPLVDEGHLRLMLDLGVEGYLLKSEPVEAILEAIRAISGGQRRLSAALAGLLVKPAHAELTQREIEILRLIAQGLSNQQIAAALGLSEGTVKNHVVNIYAKLGVRTRLEALLWAQKHLR